MTEPEAVRIGVIGAGRIGALHGPDTVETLIEAYEPFQRMKGGLPHLRLGPPGP